MNVDAIFDAFAQGTSKLHRQDCIRKKRAQWIEAKRKRCGACYHWMKTSCKPEKERGEFKSAASFPCPAFEWSKFDSEWVEKLEAELKELLANERVQAEMEVTDE